MKKIYLVLAIIIAASIGCEKKLEDKFSVKNTSFNNSSLLSEDLQWIVNIIDKEEKTNPRQALIYANKLIQNAQKNKDKRGKARGYYKRGYIQDQYLGEYGKAIADYFEALKIYQELNIYNAISSSYLGIGGIYYKLNEFDKALAYYQQALANIQQINNKGEESQLYYAIANCHMGLHENLPIIINDYIKSLTILQELKDEVGIGNCYNLMASAYYFLGTDYSQAKKYYLQALAIFQAENKMKELGNVYYNLGLLHHEMKESEVAKKYFQQAVELGKKYNYPDLVVSGEFQLGKMQASLKNHSQAIAHGLAALSAIHPNELTKVEITYFLAQSYEAIGNKDRALAYSNQTIELNKENEKNNLSFLIKENEQHIQVSKFEISIKRDLSQSPYTNWFLGAGILLMLVSIYILLEWNYRKRIATLTVSIKVSQTRIKDLKITLSNASKQLLTRLYDLSSLQERYEELIKSRNEKK